jgi:hypothetical protein
MARDVATIKEEWNRRLPHIRNLLQAAPANPMPPPRVNFLSLGTGAVIDPYLTSPTKSTPPTLLQRIARYAAGIEQDLPPAAALQPWDGVGDCWCAATRANVSQLAVLLGHAIVPEQVVIEHIPRAATLDPGAAPRVMELWAQYATRPPNAVFLSSASPSSSSSSSLSRTSHASSSLEPPVPPLLPYDIILYTIRQAYPDEPATAYSNDPLLGPTFFRVGRWQYDIDGKHHIQRFDLDAVVDIHAIRVDKVVVRAISNWGAPHTCLYRVRLHGYL